MALALDGSVHGNATAATLAVSLTTTSINDVICVVITTNGGPVTSVTASGLIFKKRAAAGVGALGFEFWYAIAANILSSTSITVNTTSSGIITIDAFGIRGADTTTIFDSNLSLPATANSGSVNVSTNVGNTIILEMGRSTVGAPSVDAGFTLISSADFQGTAYKVVTGVQSLSLTIGNNNGIIGDAIIVAPAPVIVGPTTLSNKSADGRWFSKRDYLAVIDGIKKDRVRDARNNRRREFVASYEITPEREIERARRSAFRIEHSLKTQFNRKLFDADEEAKENLRQLWEKEFARRAAEAKIKMLENAKAEIRKKVEDAIRRRKGR